MKHIKLFEGFAEDLIADILMDGEADEDEIEEDNRAWFAEERAQMIQELQNRFQMPFSAV